MQAEAYSSGLQYAALYTKGPSNILNFWALCPFWLIGSNSAGCTGKLMCYDIKFYIENGKDLKKSILFHQNKMRATLSCYDRWCLWNYF